MELCLPDKVIHAGEKGFASLSAGVQKRMMNNKLKEGETLFTDSKIDEAEKCFLSLVENDSDCKEAYNNLRTIPFKKDDREKSINHFTRSLKIGPIY
jgi:tetratricopeptide (TPR) repeat protein